MWRSTACPSTEGRAGRRTSLLSRRARARTAVTIGLGPGPEARIGGGGEVTKHSRATGSATRLLCRLRAEKHAATWAKRRNFV